MARVRAGAVYHATGCATAKSSAHRLLRGLAFVAVRAPYTEREWWWCAELDAGDDADDDAEEAKSHFAFCTSLSHN